MTPWSRKLRNRLKIENRLVRQLLAEFYGTLMLMVIGEGTNAQVVLSRQSAGTFLTINLGWMLAVTFGVLVSAGVSGGHINPAMTLANYVLGNISALRALCFVAAQHVAAFVAAAIVHATYHEAIDAFDGGVRQVSGANATAGIFATYPQPYLSFTGGLVDQAVGTAILAACVFAIVDKANGVPRCMAPLLVGLTVGVIGMAFGYNCGYAINPARDFGPRAYTALAGWGVQVFTINDNWFLVPIIGPCVGAVIGAWSYKLLIGIHWPAATPLSQRSITELTHLPSTQTGRVAPIEE